jgi:predicted ATP-dependent endonuclease of OLD family
MKVEKINIQSFKLIDSYKGEIGGKNVYLIGGNKKGKTSFIDAVFKGLSGKNLPSVPITDNGKKGMIEIDLGDFIARTKFKKGRPAEFELENKNFEGEADKFISSPRSYMERRIGILDFEITSFLSLSDAKQVEYIAKYMNVDYSDIDAEIEELKESRKFDKKKLAELKIKEDYYSAADADAELVDIVAISKEIEAETVKSNAYNRVTEGLDVRQKRIDNISLQIAELEKEKEALKVEFQDGSEWLNQPDNRLMSDEALAEKMQSRDNSTAINDKRKKAKDARLVEVEIEKLTEVIDETNSSIEEQLDLKGARISGAIQMEELTYSTKDEQFLYEGLPFDKNQTNTASQLIIGMKIGAMMLKELKILRVDASLIDKVEFDKVLLWAKDNDIELFIELVDREATQLQINVDND